MVESLYGVGEETKSIWIFIEHDSNQLEGVSLELLGKGRQLADQVGWKLVGLLIGHDVQDLTEQVYQYGADEICLIEHPLLTDFTADGYCLAAYQAMMKYKPSIFLLGATPDGRDLAGRLAVRLRTGLNADCTDLRLDADTGVLICEVSGFGGGVLALIEMQNHRPQMATVRPGVFEPGEIKTDIGGMSFRLDIALTEEDISTSIVDRVVGESVDLTQTQMLIVGGRGVGEHFDLMHELADTLGGEVGGTRPPVDEGNIERERQIGQTGVVCRPKIAIVCGVSGAFHFVVGIQDADTVIAINSDPEAPIFDYADYCIVADVFEVIPALISTLKAQAVQV